MKKYFLAVVALSLILAVTGCNRDKYINQTKASHDQATEILRCLDEEDVEGLKSMFCGEVASSHDLDEEIVEAMEFYSGKSVSFSSILVGGGDSMEDGELTDSHIEYSIESVETDEDATYKIVTHSYLVYKENPKFIGITYITIIDTETDARVELGEYVK